MPPEREAGAGDKGMLLFDPLNLAADFLAQDEPPPLVDADEEPHELAPHYDGWWENGFCMANDEILINPAFLCPDNMHPDNIQLHLEFAECCNYFLFPNADGKCTIPLGNVQFPLWEFASPYFDIRSSGVPLYVSEDLAGEEIQPDEVGEVEIESGGAKEVV